MNILLRNVKIEDKRSSFHHTVKDIFVSNGKIEQIDDSITVNDDTQIIDGNGLVASPGWVDIFSHFNDPGAEQKETLETGAAAAAAGGYTVVFTLPNTNPVIQNKSQVAYIIQKSKPLPVSVLPIGAATQNAQGKDLAEMYDMHNSGAVAFSDGLYPVQSAGLFLKVLQYVKAFGGVLIQQPFDTSIGMHGLMNEGIVSTRMGLPGLPAVSEEIFIQRDINLLRYTESKLHITGVSTAKGLELIKKAQKEGLSISCSVTPYHLVYTDEDLGSYDTNLKVNPPLRTAADRQALREAVLNGDVDAIASHHFPQHWDDKTREFEYAENGMIGLQTAYASVQDALPELPAEKITELFSANPRTLFGLESATIEPGKTADITLFNPDGSTVFDKASNKSKSFNSPFVGKKLKGKVFGTLTKDHLYLNK